MFPGLQESIVEASAQTLMQTLPRSVMAPGLQHLMIFMVHLGVRLGETQRFSPGGRIL